MWGGLESNPAQCAECCLSCSWQTCPGCNTELQSNASTGEGVHKFLPLSVHWSASSSPHGLLLSSLPVSVFVSRAEPYSRHMGSRTYPVGKKRGMHMAPHTGPVSSLPSQQQAVSRAGEWGLWFPALWSPQLWKEVVPTKTKAENFNQPPGPQLWPSTTPTLGTTSTSPTLGLQGCGLSLQEIRTDPPTQG